MRPLELGLQAFGPYHQDQIINFGQTREAGIFLIHGNTGAGKSSILEAMVWALYGKDAIGDKKKEQIRYTKAQISEITYVRFDFSVGTDIYRVYRELKPQKKQGTNEISNLIEKVVVAKRNLTTSYQSNEPDMAYTAYVENGLDETTKRIVSVLSMDEKQFTKIIMIPQGKFKDLLLSPPDEREELLADLLDLHRFDHYEEYLGQRVKELKTLLDGSFQKEAELKSYLVENGGDRIDDLRAEYDEIESKLKSQTILVQGLGAQIEQARSFELQELKINQYKTELEGIEQNDAHIESLKARLADYDTFKNNQYLIIDLKRFEGETGSNEVKKRDLERRLSAIDLESLKSTYVNQEDLLATAQAKLQDQGPKLEIELNKLREINTLRTQVNEAKASFDQARTKLEPHERRFKMLEADRRNQTDLQASIRTKEVYLQDLRELLTTFKNFGTRLIERQAVLVGLRLKKRDHMLAIQKHRDCHDQIPVARTMVEHWEKLQKQYAHAMLAKELVHNEACPVCGSHEHPNPPVLPLDTIDDDRRLRDIENLEKLKIEHITAKNSYEQKKKEIDEIEAKLSAEKDLFDGLSAELDNQCAKVLGQSASAQPLVDEIKLAIRQELSPTTFETLKKDIIKLGQDEGGALQALKGKLVNDESFASVEQAYREHEANCNQQKTRFELLETQLNERVKNASNLSQTEAQIKASLDGLNRQFADQQKLLLAARTEYEKATADVQNTRSELMTVEGILQAGLVEIKRIESQIAELKRQTSLDLHAMAPDFAQFDPLVAKNQVLTHDSRKQELVTSLKLIDADKKPRPVRSLGELETESLQLQRDLEQLQNRRGHMQKNFEVIDGISKKLDLVQKDLGEQEANHAAFNEIAQSFKGANEAKLSFKRFVIGMYLDKILIEANQHLHTMTLGRYQFKRSDLAIGRQQKAGLNLEIIDSYSGDTRLVNTLSGGESFMASLSLALGLSAYVQKLSGGKKMEAFFIDEGFGTLDEDTLEQAMSVLETIGKSGRTLGIISHVKELKDRIPLKLHIKGSKTGSLAHWSI